jgi:hypothetical protein
MTINLFAPFSKTDKLKCIEREIALRERVYAKYVERGMMTREKADRELALMKSIADDYEGD